MDNKLKKKSPIGVFDSGIGGLTVVRELLKVVPQEGIIYLGDTARVPYGNKSRETVQKFSTENVLFLLHHDVKLVIIACHTASSFALPFLERHFKHPILGVIDPGVEMALKTTRSGRIGVIGTHATIGSQAYPHAFARRGYKGKVTQVACPLFVPLVEEGCLQDSVTEQVTRRYLKPLQATRIDTLILGCTHYPLLAHVIQKILGEKVRLINSAEETARQTRRFLGEAAVLNEPEVRFYVSDEPEPFRILGERFLGMPIHSVAKVGDHFVKLEAGS